MNKTIKENDSLDISKFSTSTSPTELIWKDSDSIIIQYLTKTDVNGEIFLRKVFSSFTFWEIITSNLRFPIKKILIMN